MAGHIIATSIAVHSLRRSPSHAFWILFLSTFFTIALFGWLWLVADTDLLWQKNTAD